MIHVKKTPFTRLVAGLFFFSGFASLVYQVIWMRHLALFFGSDVYSTTISLSVFMGGLSLGSYAAENIVDRLKKTLFYYGIIEIIVGVYAFFFSDLLLSFKPFLKEIYQQNYFSSPEIYQISRIIAATIVLIFPTALMGFTLPLVIKGFVKTNSEMGRYAGLFYSINTFGGLTGILISAFFLLPIFGILTTTKIVVIINIVIGFCALLFSQWSLFDHLPKVLKKSRELIKEETCSYKPRLARLTLIAIFFSGMGALSLEVILTRVLSLSFSTTVYSFPIMLSCFLFGIFYGSNMASKTIDFHTDPVRYLALLQVTIGLSVMILGLLTYLVPSLFGRFLWAITSISHNNFEAASIASKFIVSSLLIVFPAILIGATFPTAVKICTPNAKKMGLGTGRVYAVNTAGAIFGSLFAGFVLIPNIGSRNSLPVVAVIFIAIGLFLLYHLGNKNLSSPTKRKAGVITGMALVIGIGLFFFPQQTVMNYNLQTQTQPELIYHGEGTGHSIDIVRGQKDVMIMMVDGNIEADTSFTQRRHFILKGHLPLLLHPNPSDVAVVGLGLGITLAATERNSKTKSISLIELSPELVNAHQYLKNITDGILQKKKVLLRIDDGRNFFSMINQKFDMITADPIHPRISGVGFLFTEEYYREIKSRLKKGGIVCQWMPMYSISKKSFDIAFHTFAKTFKHPSFWYVRGHGLFVASEDNFHIDYSDIRAQFNSSIIGNDLASIKIHDENEFLAHLLMGPNQIKAYLNQLEDTTINTDDNAYLEYQTPSEFMKKTEDIVSGLIPWAGYDSDILQNISKEERRKVKEAWKNRVEQLLPELDESLK